MVRSSKDCEVSRRFLLDFLFKGASLAVGLSILYPILKYVLPPKVSEAYTNRVLAGKVSELPPNSGKIFRFGSKPGILIRTPAGKIKAFTAICTHLSCTVQYRQDLQQIWCACHNGRYDLNGVNIAGPPPRPLAPYKVSIKGDKIWVTRES